MVAHPHDAEPGTCDLRPFGEAGLSLVATQVTHASWGTYGIRVGAGTDPDVGKHLVLTARGGGDSAPAEPSITDCTGADSCEDLLQVQFLELFSGYYRGSPHVWIHSCYSSATEWVCTQFYASQSQGLYSCLVGEETTMFTGADDTPPSPQQVPSCTIDYLGNLTARSRIDPKTASQDTVQIQLRLEASPLGSTIYREGTFAKRYPASCHASCVEADFTIPFIPPA